jgi:hypothetical protein
MSQFTWASMLKPMMLIDSVPQDDGRQAQRAQVDRADLRVADQAQQVQEKRLLAGALLLPGGSGTPICTGPVTCTRVKRFWY